MLEIKPKRDNAVVRLADRLMGALEESTLTRFMLVVCPLITVCVLAILERPIPQLLTTILGGAVGFFLRMKVQERMGNGSS